jgi:NTP pyrophosphatase (non-canonical NTP hydrolase)
MKISDFQDKIRYLYLENDKKRGINGTFIWLVEEIGELATLLNDEQLKIPKISEELSDIFAWTLSIANLLNIEMESAVSLKYPEKCVKCGKAPCQCDSKHKIKY